MKLISHLTDPVYIFRPTNIYRRLYHGKANTNRNYETVMLPIGVSIRVRPNEDIGRCIWNQGLFDIRVSEALLRLVEKGETAIDVGANIGYMTCLIAHKSGWTGRVLSFEPHPELFDELGYNVHNWQSLGVMAKMDIHNFAVSDKNGAGLLGTNEEFQSNRGTAFIISNDVDLRGETYEIQFVRLDDIIDQATQIGVLKVDVEGHEYEVLKGARSLLEQSRVRDIIFEEFGDYPTRVHKLLESHGYHLFTLEKSFFGPKLVEINKQNKKPEDSAPSHLATIAPERALNCFQKRGWRILGF